MRSAVRVVALLALTLACTTVSPQGMRVRVYKADRSPQFLANRDRFERECKFLKFEHMAEDGPNSVASFQNYGAKLGADVVVVGWVKSDGTPAPQEAAGASYRGAFYSCAAKP